MDCKTEYFVADGLGGASSEKCPVSLSLYFVFSLKLIPLNKASPTSLLVMIKSATWKCPTQILESTKDKRCWRSSIEVTSKWLIHISLSDSSEVNEIVRSQKQCCFRADVHHLVRQMQGLTLPLNYRRDLDQNKDGTTLILLESVRNKVMYHSEWAQQQPVRFGSWCCRTSHPKCGFCYFWR